MKTVALERRGRFTLTDTLPPAAPGRGEVLVRVVTVGICGTDLPRWLIREAGIVKVIEWS